MNRFLKVALSLGLVLMAASCASKKKTTDGQQEVSGDSSANSANSAIENSPISFDATGSDSGSIEGLVTVSFPYDQANLSSEARQQIKGNADWMKSRPEVRVQIEGHCDMRGSIEYNLSLGERRARAVRSYMVSLGISESRLSVISYGKEKPLAKGDSESDHSRNRRANFLPL
jgi:peptidoglycan-associated lipoprotein